tara:strand:- start:238 stop:555 length:318 start_codon:yes stop_codon:yes gene_type:complete
MKITKRQLRRIIRETVYGVGRGRGPSSVEEWTIWAETFGLDSEYDNEGQLIFYLDPEHPDAQAIEREAERAGADVQTSPASYDSTIIYTGMTDMGRLGARQMRMI